MPNSRKQRFYSYSQEKVISDKHYAMDRKIISELSSQIYKTNNEKKQKTKDYKLYLIRKKLVQILTEANQDATCDQKIFNTLKFFEKTIELIKIEYNYIKSQKNINELDLVEIAKNYAVHTKNIITFDENTNLNPRLGYNEKLISVLEKELNKIDKNLFKYFNLETSVILSM